MMLMQQNLKPMSLSKNLKTRMKELESPSFHSPTNEGKNYLTRVMVGPQHVNFGNHADHAFLAETAFHALTVSDHNSGRYLSVQYISEVLLGDILESYFFQVDKAPEKNKPANTVGDKDRQNCQGSL